jgi:hypothetical protein
MLKLRGKPYGDWGLNMPDKRPFGAKDNKALLSMEVVSAEDAGLVSGGTRFESECWPDKSPPPLAGALELPGPPAPYRDMYKGFVPAGCADGCRMYISSCGVYNEGEGGNGDGKPYSLRGCGAPIVSPYPLMAVR